MQNTVPTFTSTLKIRHCMFPLNMLVPTYLKSVITQMALICSIHSLAYKNVRRFSNKFLSPTEPSEFMYMAR
jgi:hypothetical protein